MKRKYSIRRSAFFLIGLLVFIVVSGCQFTATPADLLQGPRSTPDGAALTAAVQRELPARAKLSLAMQESSNTAVLKMDVDGDGQPEALVTYADEGSNQHVLVLRNVNGAWRKWFIFAETSSYGIDVLRTTDLDRDGEPELLIGWNQYGEPKHMLTLYHVPVNTDEVNVPKPIAELPYDTMGIGDGQGDGRPELALIKLQRDKMQASIGIYQFAANQVQKVGAAELDGSVNDYLQVRLGKVSPDRYGIIADASIGANSSTTTMLAWEAGKLVQVYPPRATGDDQVQINARTQLSGDRNGDDILDLTMLREAPGQSEGVAYSDLLWIEQYRQWDGHSYFSVVGQQYVDPNQTYAVTIPDSWSNYTFSRLKDGSDSDVALDAFDPVKGLHKEILALRVIPIAEWSKEEHQLNEDGSRYLELETQGGLVYVAIWNEMAASGKDSADTESASDSDGDEQQARKLTGVFPPDEAEMKQLFKLLPEA
ncbi:FG-GAP repeat domain-containing protein [Paenibacillus albus]|uniref:VCBS repeat-containing protein n=1 Tax=Paenibacillus albus TaxID=2495582 RepID=A0A3S9A1C5_9BACL|nr:VCBS repeat-containing protein [Paenibacillus albus]AZN39528.1 VCBS repeat-containing protein [Paenibacillus albus]